jgi:hypothetical protein
MRGFDLIGWLRAGKAKAEDSPPPAHGAPDGTFSCLVREVRYWSGPRTGEVDTLQGGDWELQVITDRNLLWEYEDANSVHNGRPLTISYRPHGLEQLVAHNLETGMVLRIALGPNQDAVPTTFTALGAHAMLTGIAFFQPRVTS